MRVRGEKTSGSFLCLQGGQADAEMAKTIYLVKKNPESKKENTEWMQMSGEEFYRFTHSEKGKGRYFIHLTDDVGYEADEIYIEAGYEEFYSWKQEDNRHRYLADCAKDTMIISSDVPVTGGEEMIVKKEMLKKLDEAMASLSSDEMTIIQTLYFSGRIVTEAEAGKSLGMSQQAFHYRKKKIFSKLAKFLFVKS